MPTNARASGVRPLSSASTTRSRAGPVLAGLGHPHVLVHRAGHREAQPRVVGDVVVAHPDGVAGVGGLEPEAQMAAHGRGVLQRDAGPAGAARASARARAARRSRARCSSKCAVATSISRLGVVAEPLPAAAGALHLGEQRVEPAQVVVGRAVVPHPQRQQRQQVHQVVVEQDGNRDRVRRRPRRAAG